LQILPQAELVLPATSVFASIILCNTITILLYREIPTNPRFQGGSWVTSHNPSLHARLCISIAEGSDRYVRSKFNPQTRIGSLNINIQTVSLQSAWTGGVIQLVDTSDRKTLQTYSVHLINSSLSCHTVHPNTEEAVCVCIHFV
jgi:hypothetical protein